MEKRNDPSNKSRRKFLKNVGTGIVGAYAITPAIKPHAKNLSNDILDSIEGKVDLKIKINGKSITKKIDPSKTLAEFIREDLELTGTKLVCNQGECGSCTVLVNGKPVYSCHMLALDAHNTDVLTIEGLLDGEALHPLQQSFIDEDGLQCGFCTPGQIISAYAIVKENPNATDEEIKRGMSGNLCRCGAYPKIFDSVKAVIRNKN